MSSIGLRSSASLPRGSSGGKEDLKARAGRTRSSFLSRSDHLSLGVHPMMHFTWILSKVFVHSLHGLRNISIQASDPAWVQISDKDVQIVKLIGRGASSVVTAPLLTCTSFLAVLTFILAWLLRLPMHLRTC